jgi:hypothetical protein
VDRTGLGSCPVADFGISGVEPSGSATRELMLYNYLLNSSVCLNGVPKYRCNCKQAFLNGGVNRERCEWQWLYAKLRIDFSFPFRHLNFEKKNKSNHDATLQINLK